MSFLIPIRGTHSKGMVMFSKHTQRIFFHFYWLLIFDSVVALSFIVIARILSLSGKMKRNPFCCSLYFRFGLILYCVIQSLFNLDALFGVDYICNTVYRIHEVCRWKLACVSKPKTKNGNWYAYLKHWKHPLSLFKLSIVMNAEKILILEWFSFSLLDDTHKIQSFKLVSVRLLRYLILKKFHSVLCHQIVLLSLSRFSFFFHLLFLSVNRREFG